MRMYVPSSWSTSAPDLFRIVRFVLALALVGFALTVLAWYLSDPGPVGPVVPVDPVSPQWSYADPTPAGGVS